MSKRSANEGEAAQQAKLSKLEPSDTYEEALKIVYKMQETTLAHAMILTLEDEPDDVRCGALKVLEKLDPTTLGQHVSVFVGCLSDDSKDVRCGALKVLEKLDPKLLSHSVKKIISLMESECSHVREIGLKAMGLVKPTPSNNFLVHHLAFVSMEDESMEVRRLTPGLLRKALRSLSKDDLYFKVLAFLECIKCDRDHAESYLVILGLLDAEALKRHVIRLINLIENDPPDDVRNSVLGALSKMDEVTLGKYARSFGELVLDESSHLDVLQFATGVLMKLEPCELDAPVVIQMLGHREEFVSDFAMKTLCKVDNLDAVVSKVDWADLMPDVVDVHVCTNVLVVMDTLHASTLAQHATAIVGFLSEEYTEMRPLALKLLNKLAKARLVQLRRRFWVSRLLWWWRSRVWGPGSREALHAASEFEEMQGGADGVVG